MQYAKKKPKVFVMLDILNNARNLYEQAPNKQVRLEADRAFADCYDWFIQRRLAIEYNQKLRRWLFMGRYHEEHSKARNG